MQTIAMASDDAAGRIGMARRDLRDEGTSRAREMRP
jgi:hypothetical protein